MKRKEKGRRKNIWIRVVAVLRFLKDLPLKFHPMWRDYNSIHKGSRLI
jgi:hypothetical protein